MVRMKVEVENTTNEDSMMLTFTLPDMSCGHCTGAISRALKELDPACELEFDLPAQRLRVHSTADRDDVIEALIDAGYRPA